MRVHIDGILPLIKESIVEYPNGDEVSTTLIYERLDKHCTKCLRLDHELKECLVARAEAKALRELGGHHHRDYKSQSKYWNEKSAYRRSSQSRERSRMEFERSSHPPREPPQRRGYPQRDEPLETIPQQTLNDARVEVREAMLQYTSSADPKEREARKERMRQAEECGDMEEAVLLVARSSIERSMEKQNRLPPEVLLERTPAAKRLGHSGQQLIDTGVKSLDAGSSSRERIPASLRLGDSQKSLLSQNRVSATQRLGPAPKMNLVDEEVLEPIKRKPGRPPGRRKVQASPIAIKQAGNKRKKVQSAKPPKDRH
ncbi:hypothetical protein Bca4012_084724 [Brassica carinata]